MLRRMSGGIKEDKMRNKYIGIIGVVSIVEKNESGVF